MALTLKILNANQLGTIEAALYPPSGTAVAGKAALVKNIILVNTTTSAVAVNIYVKYQAGTSRLISAKDMSIPGNAQVVLDSQICLAVSSGSIDSITGKAATGSAIDFVVNGFERDV